MFFAVTSSGLCWCVTGEVRYFRGKPQAEAITKKEGRTRVGRHGTTKLYPKDNELLWQPGRCRGPCVHPHFHPKPTTHKTEVERRLSRVVLILFDASERFSRHRSLGLNISVSLSSSSTPY